MKTGLLIGDVVHADETVVQVLHEPGKKAQTDCRMHPRKWPGIRMRSLSIVPRATVIMPSGFWEDIPGIWCVTAMMATTS